MSIFPLYLSNLAHSRGSKDQKMHITARFKDIHGNIISCPRHGNPNLYDQKVHIYIGNPDDHINEHSYNVAAHTALPASYKTAVLAKYYKGRKKSAAHMF